MNKLLQFLDNHILKIVVACAIAFIVLYPKLPTIGITHTWVYVRLEDFIIVVVIAVWLVQLLRKKIFLPKPEGVAIGLYWVIGLISTLYCVFFIGSHLANFFPKLAFLEYLRRIEYMILFFAGFSSVKNKKDIRDYIVVLSVTVSAVVLYGFGQRFYQTLWHIFPEFFEKNPFCFPAFLTGNEEFAKGTPLCLDASSRVSSTFGGHYDLAAFLVFVIPVFIAIFLIVKRWYWKVAMVIVAMCSIELLNFTSSRTSFAAYLIGVTCMLIFWKKKNWIIPILLVSVIITIFFSNSVLQRFAKTVQQVKVVTINTNSTSLPPNLQTIIKKTKEQEENQAPQSPPPGTITTVTKTSTSSGSLTAVVTDQELKKLQEEDIAISTMSGGLLIQKAYALDISFTTRFQAEWPRDWIAFLKYPLLGQGYSTLTLASDNDYLRALGETGLAGTMSFLFIFLILGIYMKESISSVKNAMTRAFIFGLAGGVVGLLMNAVLIDVFEASKVAEPLWLLLGIGFGGISLYGRKTIDYRKELYTFFTSRAMIMVYLFILILILYLSSISNFFVADDYTWLRWAASSSFGNIREYFLNANGFFYRPISKTLMLGLYTFLGFQPEGYHFFIFVVHFLIGFGVYILARRIVKNKLFAFLAACLFILLPANAENIFWISTISTDLSVAFTIYAIIAFFKFRDSKNILFYVLSVLLSIFAVFSYEGAVIIPLVIFITDAFISSWKISKKQIWSMVPFFVVSICYLIIHQLVHAVSAGGDYAYSIPHLIPNILGNIFGYLGLFIFGEHFLALYTFMRNGSKSSSVLVLGGIVIVALALMVWLYRNRKIVIPYVKSKTIQPVIFLILFMVVTLLPFLGLGNIAPRYGYMAAVGFSILLAYILQEIKVKYLKDKNKILVYTITSIFVLVLGINYIISLHEVAGEWRHAGDITSHTLKFFRRDYASMPPDATIYIVNLPIRYRNAWVFPVGLEDGLWFIYQDMTRNIVSVLSIQEAKAKKVTSTNPSYIFIFDKNDMISEAKP